jgi:hypothetical protein
VSAIPRVGPKRSVLPRHHRVDDGIVLDGVRLEVAARVPEQEVLGRVIRDRTNTRIHPVGTDHAEERGPDDLAVLDVVDLQATRVVVPQGVAWTVDHAGFSAVFLVLGVAAIIDVAERYWR